MTDPIQKQLVELTTQLIDERSITPDAADCFDILSKLCEQQGLICQRFDRHATQNLLISTSSSKQIDLLLSGHVDVVPPGDITKWRFDPFQAIIDQSTLYGRGAVDMKSSVAAMVLAVIANREQCHRASLSVAILLTSDEEGDAIDGTQYVMSTLDVMGYRFRHALVGEPTSVDHVGDTVKIGRRGSLTGQITVLGQQAHVAYASQDINPLFAISQFIHEARLTQWDLGCAHFNATQFCVVSAHSDCVATNVTPREATCVVNFRYSPASSHRTLRMQVNTLLRRTGMEYHVQWSRPNLPFLSQRGMLSKLIATSIDKTCQIKPILSTSGGTSDARYIAQYVDEIIEFGPRNHTAHQIDEHISLSDLEKLYRIYQSFIDDYSQQVTPVMMPPKHTRVAADK